MSEGGEISGLDIDPLYEMASSDGGESGLEGGHAAWARELLKENELLRKENLRLRGGTPAQRKVRAIRSLELRRAKFDDDLTRSRQETKLTGLPEVESLEDAFVRGATRYFRVLRRTRELVAGEGEDSSEVEVRGGIATIMIDLEEFKTLNDQVGHVAGNIFLRYFGQLLRKCFRREDTLARVGGDEFETEVEMTPEESEDEQDTTMPDDFTSFQSLMFGTRRKVMMQFGEGENMEMVEVEGDGIIGVLRDGAEEIIRRVPEFSQFVESDGTIVRASSRVKTIDGQAMWVLAQVGGVSVGCAFESWEDLDRDIQLSEGVWENMARRNGLTEPAEIASVLEEERADWLRGRYQIRRAQADANMYDDKEDRRDYKSVT